MKSNPVKVGDKLFRYDFDHAVVEYIAKADAEIVSVENVWKKKYGSSLYGIDSEGYIVLASAGLNVKDWKNTAARNEYLSGWAEELDEEENRLAEEFIKNELPYLKEETE